MSDSARLAELIKSGPIHFVGVGGAGMVALAELLHLSGATVSGCDLKSGHNTERLGNQGISVAEGHDPSHVAGAAALVVSAAVPADHAELQAGRPLPAPRHRWDRPRQWCRWFPIPARPFESDDCRSRR